MLKLPNDPSRDTSPSASEQQETASPRFLLEGLSRPESLAQELGISPRTLARWNTRREGPPRLRIGRSIFYDIAAVREWLRSKKEHASPVNRRRRSPQGQHASSSIHRRTEQ
jgi:predicted DNA-binding transcriptional regulator AlpA